MAECQRRKLPQVDGQCLYSGEIGVYCGRGTLSWPVWNFGVWLGGTSLCIPIAVYIV